MLKWNLQLFLLGLRNKEQIVTEGFISLRTQAFIIIVSMGAYFVS
jgi:hypothetical protein